MLKPDFSGNFQITVSNSQGSASLAIRIEPDRRHAGPDFSLKSAKDSLLSTLADGIVPIKAIVERDVIRNQKTVETFDAAAGRSIAPEPKTDSGKAFSRASLAGNLQLGSDPAAAFSLSKQSPAVAAPRVNAGVDHANILAANDSSLLTFEKGVLSLCVLLAVICCTASGRAACKKCWLRLSRSKSNRERMIGMSPLPFRSDESTRGSYESASSFSQFVKPYRPPAPGSALQAQRERAERIRAEEKAQAKAAKAEKKKSKKRHKV